MKPSLLLATAWRAAAFAIVLLSAPATRAQTPAPARPAATNATVTLSVDFDTTHQTMEGFGFFGGQNVWWGSSNAQDFYSDAWLDLIVNDMGISMWRNEIYPHIPPTSNTTPNQDAHWDKQRPLVQALKAKADAAGSDVRVILTVWSPPRDFKWDITFGWAGDVDATRTNVPQTERNGGTLSPEKYDAYAQWLIQAIQMYKDAGVNVYAISPQNEPMFEQTFNSCAYTTYWYADMINAVMPQVKAVHPEVLVFGSENMLKNEGAESDWRFFFHNTLRRDSTTIANVDRLAVHGYQDGVSATSGSVLAGYWTNHKREFALPYKKPTWMTETSSYVDNWESTANKPGAFALALDIHSALAFGDVSAWVWWQGSKASGISEFELMSGTTVSKKYYVSKQFYRFIRPGTVRVGASSPDSNVALTAYQHPDTRTQTLVLFNTAQSEKQVSLAGTGLAPNYKMYVTSATQNCAAQADSVTGATTITLPPRSVVTLQSQPLVTPATEPEAQARVVVFPNPGTGTFRFHAGGSQVRSLTVTSVVGSVVKTMTAAELRTGRVDLSDQPNGVYFFTVRSDRGQQTLRVLKQ